MGIQGFIRGYKGLYDQNEIKRSKGLNYFPFYLILVISSVGNSVPSIICFKHSRLVACLLQNVLPKSNLLKQHKIAQNICKRYILMFP